MDSETPFQPWASKDSAKSVKNEKDLGDAKLHRENVNQPKHTQTASYDKESASVSSTASGPSSAETPAPGPSRGKESKMDPVKIASMQQIVENTLSPEGRQRVAQLLEAVEALSGPERLLLYLRLPTGVPPHDPLKQPINPLGSRAELQQTVTWIQTHLEVDPDVSLPKQDVYDEYIAHCMNSNMKPLSTADFGKVMKQVYPSVRPRRLGTRGNSRYCYAGLRKKIKLEVPQLPDLGESSQEPIAPLRESDRIVCDWAESKLGVHFASVAELSRHLSTRTHIAPGPPSASPPRSTHGHIDDAASRQLMKQLKRKIQTQGTPGRPKKNKAPEITGELPPSTSYPLAPPPPHAPPPPPQAPPPLAVKHEGEPEYYPPYPLYEGYPAPYPPPPRLDYRDPYAFEPYSHDNLPINLSSDASLDLSTERDWRRRPTSPPAPPARPLPGKKLILEAYQSEARPPSPPAQYLPKKMRAAESLGRLAAEQAPPPPDPFLEDPKNSANRSKVTAAALARERRQAASPPRAPSAGCCDVAGVICKERHSEILNRERVISICNIDKHDLDDYLNEGSSQEHEEELLQYFQKQRPAPDSERPQNFLDPAQDPQDDHSQGKNEKISQLRELLARNLKNQSGSGPQAALSNQKTHPETSPAARERPEPADGALRPLPADPEPACADAGSAKLGNSEGKEAVAAPFDKAQAVPAAAPAPLYNGNCHTEPQSPTTRTQQYDFVPISDGCHSPGNGFSQRGHSPVKVNKPALMSSSLQTSPISHSTAASPFVSPRNTPVPRSRLCSRPIPKLNGRKRRNPLSLGMADSSSKFVMPNEKLKGAMCVTGVKYCPMSAPPSPNILTHFKNQIFQCHSGMPNGSATNVLSFLPNAPFREHMNGEIAQPLSADPLSSEVSQFFQEPIMSFRPGHDPSFRSQSVPLKPGINNIGLMSYNNTPVGSVPPTPVPNEFCDFADTCDISKAGLNSETLDKIYDAIDSSNEVLNSNVPTALLNSNDTLTNGCDALSEQQILTEDHLNSFIPGGDLLDRTHQFTQSFTNVGGTGVELINEELLKRANSIEFDPSDLVTEKNKYYNNTSRSVPSTPLPYRRTAPNLQIDPQRSRELFPETNSAISNGISSKSVPSTPQLVEKRVFSYSNKDFLINGNSVEVCPSAQLHGAVLSDEQGLTSPLHDMLREDILVEPLTPATDLLADFDKIGGTPYGDL